MGLQLLEEVVGQEGGRPRSLIPLGLGYQVEVVGLDRLVVERVEGLEQLADDLH